MICYRDTTFCDAACGNNDCPLKLTPAVHAASERWWGGEGAPIAVADRSEGCPEYQAVGGVIGASRNARAALAQPKET